MHCSGLNLYEQLQQTSFKMLEWERIYTLRTTIKIFQKPWDGNVLFIFTNDNNSNNNKSF